MMRTNLGTILLLAALTACGKTDRFSGLGALAAGARVTGIGDLGEPRYAAGPGNFLVFTEAPTGLTAQVFRLVAPTLQVQQASFRMPTDNEAALGIGASSANDDSFSGSVSGTGALVAFVSLATNLLDPEDAFLLGLAALPAQVYVHDAAAGRNEIVSVNDAGFAANGPCAGAVLSASGRFVAFASTATNLHPDATTGVSQVYVFDRAAQRIFLISMALSGKGGNGPSTAPAIDAEGRVVAFRSRASDLVMGDGNASADVFAYDRSLRTMELASVDGVTLLDAGEPAINGNGMVVAFSAIDATTPGGIRQIYVRDRRLGMTEKISDTPGGTEGNDDSGAPALSPDGRFVAFHSDASNLGPPDSGTFTDVFLYDRRDVLLLRLTVNGMGAEGDGDSHSPTIAPDGKVIAFATTATNLLAGDTDANLQQDIVLLPNPFGS